MRHRNTPRGFLTAATAALAVGVWAASVAANDEATFNAAYQAGVAARKAAAEVGFEWRDTRKMLKKAKKLAAKGEYEQAVELANRAKRQGELGVTQAAEQETAWKGAVLK